MSARLLVALLTGALLGAAPTASFAQQTDPHAGHVHKPTSDAGAQQAPGDPGGNEKPAAPPLPSFVPPVTDEMRAAAFPDVHGHATHDTRLNVFVLFDQLEWRSGNGPGSWAWSNSGWVGGDRNRLWFRTEGDGGDDGVDGGRAHVLYGRAIARWWAARCRVRAKRAWLRWRWDSSRCRASSSPAMQGRHG